MYAYYVIIIAYGPAASQMLFIAQKPVHKMCALVAYYPPSLPSWFHESTIGYPNSLSICAHLPAGGVQKRAKQHEKPKCKCYEYPGASEGFAELDHLHYHSKSAELAWSRSLEYLRKGFGNGAEKMEDLEKIWEAHTALEFATKDAAATMATMTSDPYVNHVPTMTGGIGEDDLHRFYEDYFIPGNPPSLKMELISRTIGTDRVVDEMHVSFKHTQEIPWMLPGVKPTGKMVEIALVAIVCIRGGKLSHEHIYWDQAGVLVQIGLLDPDIVPGKAGREKIAERLPIVGAEGARKVVNKNAEPSNELIPDW